MRRALALVLVLAGLTGTVRAQVSSSSSTSSSSSVSALPALRPAVPPTGPPAQSGQQAGGRFGGSVPPGPGTGSVIALTLPAAVERALRYNLGILTFEAQVDSARAARWHSLAALLPAIDARIGETRQTTNLAAFGFDRSLLPGVPSVVGPFPIFDARVYVSQPLIDLSARREVAASRFRLDAARLEARDARDVVVLLTTSLYLQAVAHAQRIEAVRQQVASAQSLLALAVTLHDAGATAGIDVVRAQVQLRAQRQRQIAAETDFAKGTLQLARVVGVPAAQPLELTDRDTSVPLPAATLDEAIAQAAAARADYQAARARVQAAVAAHAAAQAAALPSVRAGVDYGAIGSSPGTPAAPTQSAVRSRAVFDRTAIAAPSRRRRRCASARRRPTISRSGSNPRYTVRFSMCRRPGNRWRWRTNVRSWRHRSWRWRRPGLPPASPAIWS